MVDTFVETDQGVAVTGPSIGPDVNDACAAGHRGRASLVSLPAELLVLILTNLDHKHLLQCCIVCIHLHTVILGSVRLQYTSELAADGMVDGDSCALAAGERLQILRDQRARWRSATYLVGSTICLPYAQLNYLAYADGVLVASCTSRPTEPGFERAILCSMPSRYVDDQRAVPLALPAENVAAVALDPTQDLIILIGVATGDQGGHGMEATFTVYPRSINGSTKLPAVSWEKWGPDNTRMIIHRNRQIYEDFDMFSPIHGERSVANLVDQDAPDGALHILDFNVHRPRPTSVDNDPSANVQLISEPSTINFPECFPEPVTTRLPYYSTPLTGIPDDHILAMDQDRIVAVPVSFAP
ncbi:hypothetical protein EWM64_g7626 [Hericium alpestre]|uniref:F-box domain-containing protein n=1 Tax=Hericium alpestre TaxID=135208 RepID=A0A4Y9ZQ45_9AGAM|nr:hypothetical protein EWM64_g7626 [Hericium alpestre]